MTALCIDSASKYYERAAVLSEVSLQVPDNAITALIGPSGCGKSTLLKLCNGLIRPDRGNVRLFGAPIDYTVLPGLRRRVGYAVQGSMLFPHLTALANITLLAERVGWRSSRIEERVIALMDICQLETSQLERYPHQLSGGQLQRVSLCRAMMLEPDILLLDEPFAAIDPITRSDVHQNFLALHKAEPTTALLVTHDIREALLLADHIVVMGAGTIVCSETKTTLLERNPDRDPEALLHSILQRTQI